MLDLMSMTVRGVVWRARITFHDWMWTPTSTLRPARRLARRLPLYFSDPGTEHDYQLSGSVNRRTLTGAVTTNGLRGSVTPAPWNVAVDGDTTSGTVRRHAYSGRLDP